MGEEMPNGETGRLVGQPTSLYNRMNATTQSRKTDTPDESPADNDSDRRVPVVECLDCPYESGHPTLKSATIVAQKHREYYTGHEVTIRRRGSVTDRERR